MQEAHLLSIYKDIPLSDEKCRRTIATIVSSPTQFAYVAEKENEVCGVLLGVVDEWIWSRKKEASDVFFYVNDKCRGSGYFLAKKFLEWAGDRSDVKLIGMANSSGIGDSERVEKLFKRLGLKRVGGIYLR